MSENSMQCMLYVTFVLIIHCILLYRLEEVYVLILHNEYAIHSSVFDEEDITDILAHLIGKKLLHYIRAREMKFNIKLKMECV